MKTLDQFNELLRLDRCFLRNPSDGLRFEPWRCPPRLSLRRKPTHVPLGAVDKNRLHRPPCTPCCKGRYQFTALCLTSQRVTFTVLLPHSQTNPLPPAKNPNAGLHGAEDYSSRESPAGAASSHLQCGALHMRRPAAACRAPCGRAPPPANMHRQPSRQAHAPSPCDCRGCWNRHFPQLPISGRGGRRI